MSKSLIKYLSEFITSERIDLFDQVLSFRTRYLTIVLEDIYQSQNASAVVRTADCFGIQDMYVIENRNNFEVNKDVVLGASKWVELHRYNKKEKNSKEAIRCLRKKGYRIVATSPHVNGVDLESFDLTKGPAAIIFGTEKRGISETVFDEADEFIRIPMVGFTESFNISVSAAIVMHHLTHELRNRSAIDWKLSESEKEELKLQWLRKSIKRSDLLEKKFYEQVK